MGTSGRRGRSRHDARCRWRLATLCPRSPRPRAARRAVHEPERRRPRHHRIDRPRPARTMAEHAGALPAEDDEGGAGPRRLRRHGGRAARTDGIRLAILGLHNCENSTVLHLHASGLTWHPGNMPLELNSSTAVWIRDSRGAGTPPGP